MAIKAGPLSHAELLEVWKGVVDKSFRDPLLEAGDGQGLEAYGQAFEQLARVSRAIDLTTQALFICPWSGQTNPPAAGAAKATVTLTFTRTKRTEFPLVLMRGTTYVEEETTDAAPEKGETVLTERRYILTEDLVFHPGEQGPYSVPAIAELVGYGYNNPLPGTIRHVVQAAPQFENDGADVSVVGPVAPDPTAVPALASVVTLNEADTYVPEHVGQYTLFTAGSNAGKVGRIVAFTPPDLSVTPAIGSVVEIALDQSFDATTYAGTFEAGETVQIDNIGPVLAAYGRVLGERVTAGVKRVTFVLLSGGTGIYAVLTGATVTGLTSGATATVRTLLQLPNVYTAESDTASWKILDWAVEWGLTCTNELSPTDGRAGLLDELGNERNIHRGPGETDEVYRERVKEIADVVSPNAIRRTLNKVLGAVPWCFREVGLRPELPGFFYDGNNIAPGATAPNNETSLTLADQCDPYDTDVIRIVGTTQTGTIAFGSHGLGYFMPDERVVYESASGDVYAEGFITFSGLSPLTFVSPWTLFLIRKTGGVGTYNATNRVRGLTSGGILTGITFISAFTNPSRRFRYWLDYAEFRAFFLIGVQRLGFGEFGFPYDGPAPSNAYDASPYDDFYDGAPIGAAAFYLRLYQAIEAVKAGGVGWNLYVEDGTCP